MPYQHAESEATLLRYWSPIVVPGIAQTPRYVHITMIIGHPVLYRLVESPEVMAEQCAHLADVAQRANMALHVLPEGKNMGVWGALNIATGDSSVTVRVDTIEDITSTAPSTVAKATVAFERILGAALPCDDSLALIRSAEGQWKTRIA